MKTKLTEAVTIYLDDETKKDPSINPIEKNILAALAMFAEQNIQDDNGSYFFIPFSTAKSVTNSLNKLLAFDRVKVGKMTVYRGLNKLDSLGYIRYTSGLFRKNKQMCSYASFTPLKGFKNYYYKIAETLTAATLNEENGTPVKYRGDSNDMRLCDVPIAETLTAATLNEENGTPVKYSSENTQKNSTSETPTESSVNEENGTPHYITLQNTIATEPVVTELKEKEIEKDKKDKEKENAGMQNANTMSMSSFFSSSLDGDASRQETETNKKQNDMQQNETNQQEPESSQKNNETQMNKETLNRCALLHAVLRRAGWRSQETWNADMDYFRQQCQKVYANGDEWTERYISRLNTIAQTQVKDLYTDDIATRVMDERLSKAFINVDRLMEERISKRRRLSEKDNEYFQRITSAMGTTLREKVWNRMAIRITRRCNLMPDD